MKPKLKKWLIRISFLFNFIFILLLLWQGINSPSYKLGRLEQDIYVGYFASDSILFKLPKGLTVSDLSQRGISAIGQFENNRFDIVITSDDERLVNYSLPDDSLDVFGNYYSADVLKYKSKE